VIERYSRPEMAAVWSERSKLQKWLQVEIAAVEAWAELGKVPPEDVERIRAATVDECRAAEYLRETHHDMTAFLRSVADSLGEESRFVHMGLTSSDVIDTALALQLVEAADILLADIDALQPVLEEKALQYKDTLTIGRTHGVHAEPTTFGLKLAVWVDEMRRNRERLVEARRTVAVGAISGPVGTHASAPPELERLTCEKLGLGVEPVSTQIIHRDRHAQFVSTLALIGASLEKFALEIRALQRTEVLEAEEPFAEGQTGSSAMPHKRNPEKVERICGLARLLRGYSVTALENVALWHERDISHSSTERVILPDACLALDYMLDLFTFVMRGLIVYPENMLRNLELTQGLVFSQRVLLALIEKGLGREEAYKLVQRNAMRAWRERTPLLELLATDGDVMATLDRDELADIFDYGYYTRHVDEAFARLGLLEVSPLYNPRDRE
jgi:adenylosuccinate lyase